MAIFSMKIHKKNGSKGQGGRRIVKIKGYGSNFQFKLVGLMTYISPHLLKLQKSSVSIPIFLELTTVLKKKAKPLSAKELSIQVTEIRIVTQKRNFLGSTWVTGNPTLNK